MAQQDYLKAQNKEKITNKTNILDLIKKSRSE